MKFFTCAVGLASGPGPFGARAKENPPETDRARRIDLTYPPASCGTERGTAKWVCGRQGVAERARSSAACNGSPPGSGTYDSVSRIDKLAHAGNKPVPVIDSEFPERFQSSGVSSVWWGGRPRSGLGGATAVLKQMLKSQAQAFAVERLMDVVPRAKCFRGS